MNTTAPQQNSAADNAKLVVAIAIIIGAIFGYYHYADSSQLFRVLGVVGAVVVALLITAQTMMGRAAISFMGDARMETRKVVWPTKQETMQVTLVVIIVVMIIGVLLWLFDMFLGWAIQSLLGA